MKERQHHDKLQKNELRSNALYFNKPKLGWHAPFHLINVKFMGGIISWKHINFNYSIDGLTETKAGFFTHIH